MWEPCTSRTFARALTPAPDASTSSTHGPPALTSARAWMVVRAPLDGVLDGDLPDAVDLPDLDRARAGADFGAAIGGVARGEHDEAGVIDETVGIFKAPGVAVGDQRLARPRRGSRSTERVGGSRLRPPIWSYRNSPSRSSQAGRNPCMVRQNETKRPDDVGRDLPEDFALDQRLADQPELVIFEIAQAAMHELGRPGRRPARQVIHFTQENRIAPARRIARDAAAIDAASDDGEVENSVQRDASPALASSLSAISLSVGVTIKSESNEKQRLDFRRSMLKQSALGHSRRSGSSSPETETKRVHRLISGPSSWQRTAAHDVDADGDRGDRQSNPLWSATRQDWNRHGRQSSPGDSAANAAPARGTKDS